MQIGLFGSFTGQLRHSGHGLALFLALLDFLQHHLGRVGRLVQIVVHLGLYEVAHVFVYAHPAVRFHRERAELDFRLALEHGFLDVYGYCRYQSVSDVAVLKVLAVELLYRLGYVLFERALVCASLCGVLSVDERVVLITILSGVREGNLYVLAFEVYDGVYAVVGHRVVEQVFESVAAQYPPAVVHDGQSGVQVCVVAEHCLHYVVVERVVDEQRVVRFEVYVRAVLVLGVFRGVARERAALERRLAHLAVPVRPYLETRAECVHRFHAHAVQSDALLERLRVVFAAGVEHAHRLDELSLRYAAAVVAHRHAQVFAHVDFYPVAGVHLELVYRVVYHFFQQYVYAVFRQIAVTEPAYIHARSGAHVFHVRQVPDVVVGIFRLRRELVFYVCYVVGHLCLFFKA